jgi:fatty acid desaturase
MSVLYFFVVVGVYFVFSQGYYWGSFWLGVFSWFQGTMGHDAGHFSMSRIPWINNIGELVGTSMLGSPIMWQHQHTYAHHSFTNDFDRDPDLHHFHVFLRVHRQFQWKGINPSQSRRLFIIWAYSFVLFGTCLQYPLDMIMTGALHGRVEWTDRKRPVRAALMGLHLIVYVAAFMILPMYTFSTWWKGLIGIFIHMVTASLLFAFFSQVNHINEAALDDQARQKRAAARDPAWQNSWAIEQIETSNNFATGSSFWFAVSLGLNYQIEHHLFPGLNHCHLHLVAPVVEKTCKEFGILYKNYQSGFEALDTVFEWLNRLSDEPDPVARSTAKFI